eukprot:m51a1_g2537 hypothetical protein (498) ;mRNA; f:255009-256988
METPLIVVPPRITSNNAFTVKLCVPQQWRLDNRLSEDDVLRCRELIHAVKLQESTWVPCDSCGKCGPKTRKPFLVVDYTANRDVFGPFVEADGVTVYNFDRCRVSCSSSRLHLRAEVAIALELKGHLIISNHFISAAKDCRARRARELQRQQQQQEQQEQQQRLDECASDTSGTSPLLVGFAAMCTDPGARLSPARLSLEAPRAAPCRDHTPAWAAECCPLTPAPPAPGAPATMTPSPAAAGAAGATAPGSEEEEEQQKVLLMFEERPEALSPMDESPLLSPDEWSDCSPRSLCDAPDYEYKDPWNSQLLGDGYAGAQSAPEPGVGPFQALFSHTNSADSGSAAAAAAAAAPCAPSEMLAEAPPQTAAEAIIGAVPSNEACAVMVFGSSLPEEQLRSLEGGLRALLSERVDGFVSAVLHHTPASGVSALATRCAGVVSCAKAHWLAVQYLTNSLEGVSNALGRDLFDPAITTLHHVASSWDMAPQQQQQQLTTAGHV